MKCPKVIGIIHEYEPGQRVTEWHANGALAAADYNTICGLDGNDPDIGTFGVVVAPKGQKINCPTCWHAWHCWRQFKRSDFSK